MSIRDEEIHPQQAARVLEETFRHHDQAAFAALSPGQRTEQEQARRILWLYVQGIWEGAKARGLHPAQRPDWTGVAAINDLAAALYIFAQNAASDS
jgi:hypothetical protein